VIPSLRNAVVLAVAVSAVACSRDSSLSGPAAPKTSFSRIQAEIITPGCVSCHTTKSAYGAESGLLLEPDVAYENLVGISPKNTAAASAGMRRVAAGDPQKSFLVTKLHWELFDGGSGNFGSPMPLGATSLSVGQLEFVRRWIAAGALRTGDDIDTTLLADHTLPVLQPFTPLTPPAFGIQLTTGAFTVASNFEREFFLYRALGNATDIYVNRIETKMRTGSHHFLLYTFSPSTPAPVIPAPDVVRDIRNANGSMNLVNMIAMGYHVFLGGSMTPYSNYVFPDGVALRIPVNSSLDLNSHYVNTTVGEVPGEAFANLYLVNPSQVVHAAKTLNLNNTSITLPPSQRTTISKTFLFDAPTTIVTLTSHMHARGERFVIRIVGGARDGEIVYDNANWAHPDIVTYTPPIILQTGQGLRSETTFNNTTTRTILFGLTSEDEMDIIFGYYY
jgi:hypothetical protein